MSDIYTIIDIDITPSGKQIGTIMDENENFWIIRLKGPFEKGDEIVGEMTPFNLLSKDNVKYKILSECGMLEHPVLYNLRIKDHLKKENIRKDFMIHELQEEIERLKKRANDAEDKFAHAIGYLSFI